MSRNKAEEDPSTLLDQATILLQTGQPEVGLSLAERALEISPDGTPVALQALNLTAEIYVELGEIETAREHFLRAVKLDPEGEIPESEGGGAEKFLWLAQLSEEGGADSVRWFERGVTVLRRVIQSLEQRGGTEDTTSLEEKKKKLANALCGVVEIYMTDLSWEDDAETRCESLVTEALLVAPESPECLQTLASVRISQLKTDDAKAALRRSLDIWRDLAPEDIRVPDFPTRISLSRLLMEVQMENEALEVLERLVLEDDQSVEALYLGGWCLYLLGEKGESASAESSAQSEQERRQSTLHSSRDWLKASLKLYELIDYEDERLKEHALELVHNLDKELGEDTNDDSDAGEDEKEDVDEDGWEDEIEANDSDDDEEMKDS
ncbi:hypothetical protein FQN54_005724 [Arachnomyces sp. PD_36]|nr:hypothetical protein FQN54_005724 [Arachnomyces sp. PD_36]